MVILLYNFRHTTIGIGLRIKFIASIFILLWTILLARVYSLSIKSNKYYETLSQKNIIRKDYLPPIRGIITDRHGELLANNRLGFSIKISPHLNNKTNLNRLKENILSIATVFELEYKKLIKEYKTQDSIYNHSLITIVDFIDYDKVIKNYYKFSFNDTIQIVPSIKRFYPNNDNASHVIGYISKASKKDYTSNPTSKITQMIGKSGIEKYYNSYLEGRAGYKKYKVTAFNKEIEEIERKMPDDNHDLMLNIDIRLQRFIHNLFIDKPGAVIVMKTDGEILSAGSFPEYDINMFINGISVEKWDKIRFDFNHPFTNKLVNGLYPPGSIIKMGVALSFLNNNISKYESFNCTGDFYYSDRNFRCWKDKGHKNTNMTKAIKESCDDYFYKGSLRVGINNISDTLIRMGFSQKSGVDLPNEFYGVIPNKEWKKNRYNRSWLVGETLISAIGQGYTLTTPMQVAQYTALLATGLLPKPHFAKSMNGKEIQPELQDVLTINEKKNLPFIRRAMYKVCNEPHGTAINYLHTPGIKLAGKTGTAQVVSIPQSEKKRMKEFELKHFQRSHAWLSVYFPYKNPKYVITILAEHGGHGGHATGAETSKIVNYMKKLGYEF